MEILIVDDEPIARNILEKYILKMPELHVAGKCKNALEAFSILNKQVVDLILLDINMPEVNGMDLMKTIKNPPLVIFTTAYSEYAAQSYELDAVDYLVKPISFERFLKAIHKASAILQPTSLKNDKIVTISSHSDDNILFVKSESKLIKIDLSHLWLVEGLKDYVRLWTDSGNVVVHTTMKSLEEQLSTISLFIRVNKSYIINMKYVKEVDGNTIRIKDQAISIGFTYRGKIQAHFEKLKLL